MEQQSRHDRDESARKEQQHDLINQNFHDIYIREVELYNNELSIFEAVTEVLHPFKQNTVDLPTDQEITATLSDSRY